MPKISAKLKRGHTVTPNGGAKCRWSTLNAGEELKIDDFRREALSTWFGRKLITLSVHLICLQHAGVMQRVARVSQRQLILVDTSVTQAPFTRYNRLSNPLYNRFDNRLYRVNGVLEKLFVFPPKRHKRIQHFTAWPQ